MKTRRAFLGALFVAPFAGAIPRDEWGLTPGQAEIVHGHAMELARLLPSGKPLKSLHVRFTSNERVFSEWIDVPGPWRISASQAEEPLHAGLSLEGP